MHGCAHLLSESFQCLRGNPGTDKQLPAPASAFTNRNLEAIFSPETAPASGGSLRGAGGSGGSGPRGCRPVPSPRWLVLVFTGVIRLWRWQLLKRSETKTSHAGTFHAGCRHRAPGWGMQNQTGSNFLFSSTSPERACCLTRSVPDQVKEGASEPGRAPRLRKRLSYRVETRWKPPLEGRFFLIIHFPRAQGTHRTHQPGRM